MWRRGHASVLRLIRDNNALAAVEFAMILPIMLVLFFGTVEFSSGVEVDRKVNLAAHTLSDLTSQSPTTGVSDAELGFFFSAGASILLPYSSAPLNEVISELYVDANTGIAYVQWSKAFQAGVARVTGSPVSIPPTLAVKGTYLIFSEVNYRYKPTVGYVMSSAGVTLSASAYTRPRQATCVIHPAATPPTACTMSE
ncbi:MAG TPA: TadE/TadG family type IV pilus assembly protein [Bradyrhizobium sp.]|nr:TadE/TadG family type IV pilus assembly protein [Bradyrhizobium sp.]